MITISSLSRYQGEMELRWLNGALRTQDNTWWVTAMFRPERGETIFHRLPIGMLPFLVPGLVVAQGKLLATRKTGSPGWSVIQDLSLPEVLPAREAIRRRHYSLDNHFGGEHQVLRYISRDWTILIPAMELIRFLFLHSKVLAHALLAPMGLMNLAVTPNPGIYPEIQIDFSSELPRRLLRPEFIQEFAWAAVHPEGRRAWDSVRDRSLGQRSLMLDPPPLRNCRIEFRGVALDKTWLVLEITALSRRVLPARTIHWTHPSERKKEGGLDDNGPDAPPKGTPIRPARPAHAREHWVGDDHGNRTDSDQDVVLLGGKRGVFSSPAKVVKVLSPARPCNTAEEDLYESPARKARADAGQRVDRKLPPKIVTKKSSMGEETASGGLQPLEVSMLDRADWSAIGNLSLLLYALKLFARWSRPHLTLTATLVYLKPGPAVSQNPQGRRTCLVAVFTSPVHPPRVLIDVEHSGLPGGLAGLMLRYDQPTDLDEMEKHIKELLDAMVDRYGHWDNEAEQKLAAEVTILRLPKLLRMTKKAGDKTYVRGWVRRLRDLVLG